MKSPISIIKSMVLLKQQYQLIEASIEKLKPKFNASCKIVAAGSDKIKLKSGVIIRRWKSPDSWVYSSTINNLESKVEALKSKYRQGRKPRIEGKTYWRIEKRKEESS